MRGSNTNTRAVGERRGTGVLVEKPSSKLRCGCAPLIREHELSHTFKEYPNEASWKQCLVLRKHKDPYPALVSEHIVGNNARLIESKSAPIAMVNFAPPKTTSLTFSERFCCHRSETNH